MMEPAYEGSRISSDRKISISDVVCTQEMTPCELLPTPTSPFTVDSPPQSRDPVQLNQQPHDLGSAYPDEPPNDLQGVYTANTGDGTGHCSLDQEEQSSALSWLWSRRFWNQALMYMWPFSVGLLIPILGGMNNILQEEIGGNVFFSIAILYCAATVLMGAWTWFTTKETLSANWYALGDFIFAKPSLHVFCLTGGLAGVGQYILLSIVAASGGLGVYTLGSLLGSIVTSLLLDATGWCWAVKTNVGIFSYLGGVVVATGAIVHSLSSFIDNQEASGHRVIALVLSAITGFLLCYQSCVSNKLGKILGEFRRSVFWSYFSGALLLLLISPYFSPPLTLRTIILPKNWWKISQVLIAIYGAVVITIFQFKLNAAVVYCWVIAGQLLSSTVIDSMGWIGLEERPFTVYNMCGLGIVCVGVGALTYDKLQQQRSAARTGNDPKEMKLLPSEPGHATEAVCV
eukprot:Blabericola_migrator_1__8442@NODE_43_length_16904_cov_225_701966_g39_i0_p3_GENE_NODE_43_length_16904_cov_225_701966_g39_i0NODE_43_length_16904_cov_225_701966_g39_i0_p3_ORF_typecomplete_len458_score37_60DMT_YdcZ/PF04657_13/1_3e10DMT_YdcZ/PF04657_13/2_9e17_NODE_43_length_16904_cov_225_701966_g39_i067628135